MCSCSIDRTSYFFVEGVPSTVLWIFIRKNLGKLLFVVSLLSTAAVEYRFYFTGLLFVWIHHGIMLSAVDCGLDAVGILCTSSTLYQQLLCPAR